MIDQELPALDQLLDYRTRLLAQLERQPAQAARALAAIPEPEWQSRRNLAGRSVHMVLAHLRDLESMAFAPRVRRILAEEQPMLVPFVRHDWSDDQYRIDEPLTHILSAWSETRAEIMDLLPPPASDRWTRVGFHPPSGKRTLQWWAERIYMHAQAHLAELRLARLR
jgi:hypothetical protein